MASSKPRTKRQEEPAPEYDFTRGVRGKYASRAKSMRLKVLLDPDVARAFPSSEAVNDALRRVADLMHVHAKPRRSA